MKKPNSHKSQAGGSLRHQAIARPQPAAAATHYLPTREATRTTLLSLPQYTTCRPSGEMAHMFAKLYVNLMVNEVVQVPLPSSHTLTSQSETDTARRPSGVMATPSTHCV